MPVYYVFKKLDTICFFFVDNTQIYGYYMAMITKNLNTPSQNYRQIKAAITVDDARKAKIIAKSQGMTFQGWLGKIIRQEISREAQHDAS